jgi:cob(I)alamin adenosyltransferase
MRAISTDATEPRTEPPIKPKRATARSVVIVNTGHGKGKTTAAMGTLIRAVARGWKVCVVQFIKSGKWRAGEAQIAKQLGVDWWTIGDGFTWDSEDLDQSKAIARSAWEAAKEKVSSGDYQLAVLDEITYPMTWGWISSEEVAAVIRARPRHVSVIATGRDAPPELIEVADTVTEMVNIRHAYDRGVRARRGIDY